MSRRHPKNPITAQWKLYLSNLVEKVRLIDKRLASHTPLAGPSVTQRKAPKLIDAAAVIKGYMPWLRQLAQQHNKQIRIQLDLQENCFVSNTTAKLLQQAIYQVLHNAVLHGIESQNERQEQNKNTSGVIQIKLENTDEEMALHITDDGRGYHTPKTMPNTANGLMAIGQGQFTATLPQQEKALGLGLHLVKQWLDSVHGELEIRSMPHQYTTVELNIPKLI